MHVCCISREYGSSSYKKVIRSRWRSQEQRKVANACSCTDQLLSAIFVGTRQMAPQTMPRGWSCLRLEGNRVFFWFHWRISISITLITHGLCLTASRQVKARVTQTCTNVVLPNHEKWWNNRVCPRLRFMLNARLCVHYNLFFFFLLLLLLPTCNCDQQRTMKYTVDITYINAAQFSCNSSCQFFKYHFSQHLFSSPITFSVHTGIVYHVYCVQRLKSFKVLKYSVSGKKERPKRFL